MIYPLLLILTDFIALLASFTLAYIIRVQIDTRPLVQEIEAIEFIKVFLLLIPVWLVINGFVGLYSKPVYERRLTELGRLVVASFIGMLMIIGYDFVQSETIFPARLVVVYAFLGSLLFTAIARNLLWMVRRYLFRYGYGVRKVMIIGGAEVGTKMANLLHETISSGYEIVAMVGSKQYLPKNFDGKHFGSLDEALDAIPKLGIHTIIQAEFYDQKARNRKIFEAVRNHHLQYKFIPTMSEFYTGKSDVEVLLGYPVISVHQTPLIGWGRVVKRVLDIILSIIALVIFSPILLVIAIWIKVSDPEGPIIYKHPRVTRFGTKFNLYKFRGMVWKYSTGPGRRYKDDEDWLEKEGHHELKAEYAKYKKLKDDPRITKVGKIIRKTSLDELPQLFNVIKGDLSLVGPRAMLAREAEEYRKQAGGDVVLSVKGGITGLWQVSGRNDLSFEERVKLELYYVQNWSLLMDLKILIKTVVVVLKREGSGLS